MTFDFSRAKAMHASWKVKLRGFLDGQAELTIAQATSHTDCDLGKWLYSEGLRKYGAFSEMVALEKEHAEMHRTVHAVMTLKAAGKVIEAEAEYMMIESLSRRIVELLSSVEARVNKLAA